MSRWVQVDDADSSIQYTGSWFQDESSQNSLGNFGIPFQSTLHGINGAGSFSYTFTGTKVLITGTVQYSVASGSTTSNPSWVCSVDGVATPSILSGVQENRIRLCETDGLTDGVSHTITVTVTVSDNHTFWFDYVQYLPSANANLDHAFITIDYTDSGLDYGSGWQTQTPGEMTSQTGSTFTFDFNGVSLTWFGFYLSSNPTSAGTATYSIDGQSAVTFNLDGAEASGGLQYNHIFFQTAQLSSGDHKLQVVYEGNSQTTPLTITSLVVQNGAGTSSGTGSSGGTGTSSNSGSSSGSTTSAGSNVSSSVSASSASNNPTAGTGTPLSVHLSTSGGSVITVTETPARSSTTGNASLGTSGADLSSGATKSSSNIGAIVGGVVGGLAVIILLTVACLFLRRKRRSRSSYDVAEPFSQPPMAAAAASPFSDHPPSSAPSVGYSSPYVPQATRVNQPQMAAAAVSPFGDHSRVPSSSVPDAAFPSYYFPQATNSDANSRNMSPEPASTITTLSRSEKSSLILSRQHPAPTTPAYFYPPTSKAAEAGSTVANPNAPLVPRRLNSNNELSAASTDFSYSGVPVTRDEDSGIRFPQAVQDGQAMEILPPGYTLV